MKPQKYIDKILNKANRFLVEEGLFRYSVTGEVVTESGIKNPYLILTYPNSEVVRYNLREDYDIHEEEDVSISQSFAYIKRNILKDIREYNALRDNESMNLEIESDELDESVEPVEQTIPEYVHRNTPNIPDVYTLTSLDNLVGAVYKNANIPEEYVIKHAFGCDIVIEDSHKDNILVSKSLLTEEEIKHVLFDREYQITPDITESQGRLPSRYQLRPLESNEVASVKLSTPLSVFSDKTMRAVANMLGTNDFYIVCGREAYKKGVLSFDRAEFLQEASNSLQEVSNSDEVYLNKILEYDFENHQPVECTRDEYEEESNREHALNETEEEIGQMISEAHELEDAVEDLNESLDENLDENGYYDDDDEEDEEEEEDMDEDEDYEYSESLSDSRKATYFADYDTDYKNEFALTIVDFLKWQLPDERITVSDDTLSISGVNFSVDRLNHEYQTNSKDFYETGMDLVNNYKDICAENVREELNSHSEETTDDYQEDEEEYDEGYFPFE